MASKKTTQEIEKVKPRTTALANWEQEAAEEAKDAAAKEVLVAPRITHKKGVLKINDQKVEDNTLPCLILDFGCEKAFYEGRYTEDNTSTPVCYAFGRDEADLRPHPASPKPQAEACAQCPHNKFGTAEIGKGKACKDKRRLMVISSATKPKDVPQAEVFALSLPATSIKNWATYVKSLRDTFAMPPWYVGTEISTEDFKDYYRLTFKPIGKVSGDMAAAIKARRPAIESVMFAPYPVKEAEAEKPSRKNTKVR